MLAGPGAISTAIVIAGQARGVGQNAVVYASIVATGLLSYVSLRLGEPLLGRLGKTGIRVVTRIMGLDPGGGGRAVRVQRCPGGVPLMERAVPEVREHVDHPSADRTCDERRCVRRWQVKGIIRGE